MWKDTTVRKVLVPVAVRGWGLLPWAVVPLVIALVASFFGLREGTPSVTGPARLVAVCSFTIFVVLLGIGAVLKRRS